MDRKLAKSEYDPVPSGGLPQISKFTMLVYTCNLQKTGIKMFNASTEIHSKQKYF